MTVQQIKRGEFALLCGFSLPAVKENEYEEKLNMP